TASTTSRSSGGRSAPRFCTSAWPASRACATTRPTAATTRSSSAAWCRSTCATASPCSTTGAATGGSARPTPLDRAPDRRGLRPGRSLAGEHRVERVPYVAHLHGAGVRGVVDGPVVDEPAVAVEEEDLGRALGAVRPRHRLALVVCVREHVALLPGAPDPGLEGVRRMGRRVVRLDRHPPDAA